MALQKLDIVKYVFCYQKKKKKQTPLKNDKSITLNSGRREFFLWWRELGGSRLSQTQGIWLSAHNPELTSNYLLYARLFCQVCIPTTLFL